MPVSTIENKIDLSVIINKKYIFEKKNGQSQPVSTIDERPTLPTKSLLFGYSAISAEASLRHWRLGRGEKKAHGALFTRECNETSIAGGEKALTRSIAHSIL